MWRPPGSLGGRYQRGDSEEMGAVKDAQKVEAEFKVLTQGESNSNLLATTGGLVDSLAGLAGRKALVLVSEGIPSGLSKSLFNDLGMRLPGSVLATAGGTRYDFDTSLMKLGTRANAGRVTFYPVDAQLYPGLVNADAERMAPAEDPGAEALLATSQSLSLLRLAEGTGGRTLSNTPDLEDRFGDVIDSLNAYYSLGFVNSHSGDGKYHKLAVKVSREGVHVRHREGYLNKPESARQIDRTSAALLTSDRANRLGLEANAGGAVLDKGKTLRVPLTLSLPGSAITLLPAENGMSGKVSVLVARAGSGGRLSEIHREEFVIPVPAKELETMRQQKVVFTFEVLLRPGETTIAVTARDEIGQVESTVTLIVSPRPPAGS
jgi:hypothetical protein